MTAPQLEQPSPEQVAAEAFRALAEGDWERLVALLDPGDVERFREERTGWTEDLSAYTVEWLRRHDAEMPEEVAAYQVERMRRQRQESVARQLAEFGVESPEQLKSLTAVEMLTRYLRSTSPIAQATVALAQSGHELPGDLSLETLFTPRYEVLGSVPDGDGLTHVVYRMRLGPDAVVAPPLARIATLKRTPAGWRLGLTDDLFGLQGLGVSIGMDEEDAEEEGPPPAA